MSKDNFQLYTPEGWLNIEGIAKIPSLWLIVIVGARQVGKTFGALKYLMTNKDRRAIYMRRTVDEFDLITSHVDLNPFLPLAEVGIESDILKCGKNIWHFGYTKTEETEKGGIKTVMKDERGIGISLGTIAKMRGFNGSNFTDVYFDEFIPERIVVKRGGEGDAMLNAYLTINGNRELKGRPPLKLWLTANAFDISSPILSAFNLTDLVYEMSVTKKEYMIKDGAFIGVPQSEKIVKQRTETAMLSYMKKNNCSSEFYDMAVNNVFAYDSMGLVKKHPLSGYRPYCTFSDMYVWFNSGSFYVCKTPHNKRLKYGGSAEERVKAQMDFYRMKDMYIKGLVTFESADVLLSFRKFFNIKL